LSQNQKASANVGRMRPPGATLPLIGAGGLEVVEFIVDMMRP
jgi:hypothetical protein